MISRLYLCPNDFASFQLYLFVKYSGRNDIPIEIKEDSFVPALLLKNGSRLITNGEILRLILSQDPHSSNELQIWLEWSEWLKYEKNYEDELKNFFRLLNDRTKSSEMTELCSIDLLMFSLLHFLKLTMTNDKLLTKYYDYYLTRDEKLKVIISNKNFHQKLSINKTSLLEKMSHWNGQKEEKSIPRKVESVTKKMERKKQEKKKPEKKKLEKTKEEVDKSIGENLLQTDDDKNYVDDVKKFLVKDPEICENNKNESSRIILPEKNKKNILITSALPYVNNVPHLGNIIGSTLSGDVFARFCRLNNLNTLYICGTDEYGTTTEKKAMEEHVTPEQICDKYHQLHKESYEWFDISFDYFGRTSCEKQKEITQTVFRELYTNNFIESQTVTQFYCGKCEMFLADRYVMGICPHCSFQDARGDQCDKCSKLIQDPVKELKSPFCTSCGTEPITRESKHLFIKLNDLKEDLNEWFEKTINSPNSRWTSNAVQIAKSWMKKDLKPRCITRDLKWGVPVPLDGFRDKVFYVWFDAPIGYLSITATYTDEWEKWWKIDDSSDQSIELYNFMAKDNVAFHSIVFPSSLIGSRNRYRLVDHIISCEYLNYESGKFSKSRNIGVFGNDAMNTKIPSDIWRFYLIYIRPETYDSRFEWNDIQSKVNSELLNNLGNFINRSLTLLTKYFDGKIPEINDKLFEKLDKNLIGNINKKLSEYITNFDQQIRMRKALTSILHISQFGNQFLQIRKPWQLLKHTGTKEEKEIGQNTINLSCQMVCLISICIEPFMPKTAQEIRNQLNLKSKFIIPKCFMKFLEDSHEIGKPSPLFQRISNEEINELKKKFSGN
ncbi:hypothetical protein SNEBB_003452 [Seison nebaliae]|nr:hypothetical protein SNEBB_003452 [Seison nebaliae]